MGTRQIYKGDPTQKLYYVVDNFSGGMNTRDVDDNMADYQFRELLNVNLDKQGIIQSRKGFAEVTILSSLFDVFNIELPTSDYSFIKVINNNNSILEKIINNEIQGYTWVISDLTYWEEYGTVGVNDVTNPSYLETPTDINLAARSYNSSTEIYTYYRSSYTYNGSFKILLINENHINLLTYDGSVLSYTNLLKNNKELPVASFFGYKSFFDNSKIVEHVNNLYISLSDLSDDYKGILVYDRDDDTWGVWRGQYVSSSAGTGWYDMDDDLQLEIYKPKPYEITSAVSGLAQGFNILSDNPLLYINDQGTGFPSLRSIIVTNSEGGYVDKIPSNGEFVINVIKTGTFAPENLQFKFRDQNDNYIGFTIGDYDNTTGSFLAYGVDNGGYISYKINLNDLTNVDYVLIDVFWQNKIIAKDYVGFNYLHPYEQYYAVKNEYYIYKQNDNNASQNDDAGTKLTDYLKIPVDYRIIVSDVDTQEPSDLGIFDVYMTEAYNEKIFQLISDNRHRTFKYIHSTTTFTELTSNNILYDDWEHFIPLSGSLVDYLLDASGPHYNLYLDLPNLSDLNWFVNKTDIDLELTVPGIEGQYFDISDEGADKPIEGLNLQNVKLVTIDNKLVYYNGNTIYFSSLYQFDYIPNYSYVILPLLSTDEIVKIKYFKGSWIIFTKYSIWKMKGTYGDADWSITLINDSIGCIAPKTIVSIENSLYFLSKNGLYRLVQNYYQDGLENVTKADKMIPNLITTSSDVYGMLYKDQYMLFTPTGGDYDVIKMYHNIDLPDKQHPFTADIFTIKPDNLFKSDWNLLSIKNGIIYAYDYGHTDFLPSGGVVDDYLYTCSILTSNLNFGYPTHDKKIKNMYIKTYAVEPVSLGVTIWVDDLLRLDPYSYSIVADQSGEVTYTPYLDYEKDNAVTIVDVEVQQTVLGNFSLSTDFLGNSERLLHKIVIGDKGKTVGVKIEQKSSGDFGISKLGYLYKLGKVRAQR